MTQTASFKDKLKTAFSFFKWELKACTGTIVVYAILASVFTIISLTLNIVSSNFLEDIFSSDSSGTNSFGYAIQSFQYSASNIIYFLTIIFTIIYTIRVYSYLHNKRKADLYGSLPVSRITLFLSKSATAFVFSLAPALFFLGIISIISVCCGQPVVAELSAMYIKLVMGSLACISAYGLLAICCGTSINAVIIFIVVCIAYPLSAIFIKGVAGGFFDGLYSGILQDNFIMNALNPLAAYDGINIIYWLIFTVACTLGGCYLAKKRRYERAQSSFAYYLPCHIIKVLVSFLIGMFLGTLFGALNVTGYGLIGFVFGFILGSVPAFVISHLIFYKGFKKLIRTSIALGGLIFVVVATITLFNHDVFGYNNCIPHLDDVAKAGFVDLQDCYVSDTNNANKIAGRACDDFTDKKNIGDVITLHSSQVSNRKLTSSERFANVWYNIFTDAFSFDQPRYCFGYTLKNGSTIKRVYSETVFDSSYNDLDTSSIIYTDEYFENYSYICNAETKDLSDLLVTTTRYNTSLVINPKDRNDKKALADANKIISAYRKDFENDSEQSREVIVSASRYSGSESIEDYADICPDAVCVLTVGVSPEDIEITNAFSITSILSSSLFDEGKRENVVVPKSYTNTINALKEAGVLNNDNTINEDSDYYKTYSENYSMYYEYDYLY